MWNNNEKGVENFLRNFHLDFREAIPLNNKKSDEHQDIISYAWKQQGDTRNLLENWKWNSEATHNILNNRVIGLYEQNKRLRF